MSRLCSDVWSRSFEQHFVIWTGHWAQQTKSALEMISEQVQMGAKWDQSGFHMKSKWAVWGPVTVSPIAKTVSMWSESTQGQFYNSSDQEFWSLFWLDFQRFWKLNLHRQMTSISNVFGGSICVEQMEDCDTKLKPSHQTWTQVIECANSIVGRQSQCFEGLLSSRKYFHPWFWTQKSSLKTKLKREISFLMDFGSIWVSAIILNRT